MRAQQLRSSAVIAAAAARRLRPSETALRLNDQPNVPSRIEPELYSNHFQMQCYAHQPSAQRHHLHQTASAAIAAADRGA